MTTLTRFYVACLVAGFSATAHAGPQDGGATLAEGGKAPETAPAGVPRKDEEKDTAKPDAKEAPPPRVQAPKPAPEAAPDMAASQADFFVAATKGELLIPIRNQFVPKGRSRRFGDWEGRFFLLETVTWDDNIYTAEKNKEQDIILLSTLGAAFSREGSDFAAELTAAGTWEAYTDNSSQNVVDAYARGGLQYGMRRAFVRVIDIFTRRQDSQQSSVTLSGPVYVQTGEENVVQTTNSAQITGGYRWEKFALEGQYTNLYTNYATGGIQELDGYQHIGTVTGKYKPTPKVDLKAIAEYDAVNYDQRTNNEWSSWTGSVGADYRPTPKTEMFGQVGYMIMDVDQSGIRTDDSEYDGFAGKGGVRWKATAKLQVDAFGSFDTYPVTGANYQTAWLWGAAATWEISPVWTANLRSTYQKSDPSDGGSQSYYTATARLGYRWSERWEVAMQYDFRGLSSSSANSDFVNHRVSLQFSLLF